MKVFTEEKRHKHFIVLILDGPDDDGGFEVKYMKRSQKITGGFLFPEIDDLASIKDDDIVCIQRWAFFQKLAKRSALKRNESLKLVKRSALKSNLSLKLVKRSATSAMRFYKSCKAQRNLRNVFFKSGFFLRPCPLFVLQTKIAPLLSYQQIPSQNYDVH